MIGGFDDMKEFWEGKSPEERGAYIKSHYLTGNTHKLWSRMTNACMRKILKRIRNGTLPRHFMARRASADFLKSWLDFSKGSKSNSKANKLATILNTLAVTNARGTTKKLEPAELNGYNSYLDRMIPNKRRGRRVANAAPPPVEPLTDDEPDREDSPVV